MVRSAKITVANLLKLKTEVLRLRMKVAEAELQLLISNRSPPAPLPPEKADIDEPKNSEDKR